MIVLIFGLNLWVGAHAWKRVAPDHRATFGDKGNTIVAIASAVAIVLMVLGYRAADGMVFWGRNGAGTGINNLLMIFAFYLFAASGKSTRITRWIRHPQLTSVVVWSVAHLLVNGDTPSFVLFGGLGIWALAKMVLINRATGPRGAYHAPPIKSEVIAVVATLVVFSIAAAIHIWLGYNPFG
ncbi:putative NnrU family protein [Octadecabacter antarcticus 307]|uniref:Putative NnrU family protein n=1 Tax=Octadecabacter antarcticus 307 TaxID=391626 RepID=M9RA89_9RHOB|nr:NnrU family protein [Octadecabacter antarcticus]AGI69549.1 putative NnrU family protein [Octadecabacter antarcticus 307]